MARRKLTAGTPVGRVAGGTSLTPLAPADLEQRYNFPPGNAAGQNIAIAEFGGGYFASDVTAYCNKFQRPVPNVKAVSVDAPAFTLQQAQTLIDDALTLVPTTCPQPAEDHDDDSDERCRPHRDDDSRTAAGLDR